MKRIVSTLLLLAALLALTPPAPAQTAPSGTVGQPAGTGSFKVSFPASATVATRDVFSVVRDGKTVGQVMILLVPEEGMVAVQMQGSVKPGDQLVFVRHDAAPANAPAPTPPPAQASASATAQMGPAPGSYIPPPQPQYAGSYSYSDCDSSFPSDPFWGDVFAAGSVGYPGVYGNHVYGAWAYPHAGAYNSAWGHPSATAIDANTAAFRAASGFRPGGGTFRR